MASASKVCELLFRAHSLADKLNSEENTRNYIDEAIALDRQALRLCHLGNTLRAYPLSQLSIHLSDRYVQFGDVRDIEEGIELDRAALELRPPGHPDREMSLSNLGFRLYTRYDRLGEMEDLDEAINLERDALMLCPLGHHNRSISLNNLAVRLSARYSRLGALKDLDETIDLGREALELCPPGHPLRSTTLIGLAAHLYTRYQKLGDIGDLDKAIFLNKDALELCPPGHPQRSMSLNDLAVYLHARYATVGSMKDLDETISLDRDALALRPPGHPLRSTSLNNLTVDLHTRYQKLGIMQDLDDAIILARDALALCPPGHPTRAGSLENLANYLASRFKRLGQLKDKEEIFNLYAGLADAPSMGSSSDLSASKAWIHMAEHYRHSTTVLAYETTLRLLAHHLTALPALPQHLTLVRDVASSLAVDAFSACLHECCTRKAVELLEQGRGVFLGQLTRLRSPVGDVLAAGTEGEALAKEFTHLSSLIRESFGSAGADQHDHVCSLNIKLQKVTSDIRQLPGLSRFLLPPLYSDLQCAAACGPVIVVNASQHGCDALVVSLDRGPIHIPLEISREEVHALTTEMYRWTKEAKLMAVWKHLAVVLRQLWNEVVLPIAEVLQTIHPLQSRVWWCPTSEFILLPLHAAGTYRNGQPKFADLYVSSYTPSLSALIHARRGTLLGDVTREKRFVAVGQATAAGESKLQSISKELTNIGERVGGLATFTRIEGPEASISRVIDGLCENDWVHLACHGLPNREEPFQSAFGLHDGRLTIERIMQCELEHPKFAYLSACHTTAGDKECPDEMIHLASAMQFVGFRSVIGTMWAVDDAQTIKITSRFYENMKDVSGQLDHTRAAVALHETMRELERKVTFDQRILYVHIGA